jgi:outer membrane protein assembly factor BamB
MAALDARTGETVWASEPLLLGRTSEPAHQRVAEPRGTADNASYASPILVNLGGQRQVIGCSLRHAFGVDADTGELLWTRPLQTRYSVIAATPVLAGDAVFVTAPDTEDARLYRLRVTGNRADVESVWSTQLDTCHGGLVFLDGSLFGSWYRNSKGWACVDARTGQVRYQTDVLAKGAILYADARLYCLSEEGDMALLKPTPNAFEFAGRFRLVPERKSDVWTHPVILDRKLYLRYHETLFCYDIAAR